MNPITNMRNLNKMNDRELDMGLSGTNQSWHNEYKDSAWIFVGGLPYDLTEGDIICVFSQFGEIVHINLVRDLSTGKSKGFAFICYEDQRSTILSVDNFNGMKLIGRLVRVDHVHTYKLPKDLEKMDADRRKLFLEGCAPQPIVQEQDEQISEDSASDKEYKSKKKKKKGEKKKKSKKNKKAMRRSSSHSDDDSNSDTSSNDFGDRRNSAYQKQHKEKYHKNDYSSSEKKYRDRKRRSRSRSNSPYQRDSRSKPSRR